MNQATFERILQKRAEDFQSTADQATLAIMRLYEDLGQMDAVGSIVRQAMAHAYELGRQSELPIREEEVIDVEFEIIKQEI